MPDLYLATDRRLALHVRKDGRINATVSIPPLDDMIVSHHAFRAFSDPLYGAGWRYVLDLIARAMKEWDQAGSTYQIVITFETEG